MSDRPQVVIVSPRRGRPKLSEPTSPVSTRLPQRHHDRLIQLASKHDVSVSKLIQKIVQQAIEPITR